MKKILYILSNEPTGGIGKFVLDFTSHFSSDLVVDYLMYTDKRNTDFQNKIKKDNNEIYYLPDLSIKKYPLLMKLTDDFFKKHANDYEIVHLTFPGIVDMCFRPAKKYGIKHRIIHSQNSRLSDNYFKSIRNKLFTFNYQNLANHYLACSKEAAKFLYGNNSHEIVYIHNAINCNEYKFDLNIRKKMREEYLLENKRVFLAAGRLENQKNISFVIDIFYSISKMIDNARLFIIGDGPLKDELVSKVHKLSLDEQVTFIGFTNKLNDYFCMGDLLLFPSLYEGLPLTVVGAQNCGLPCLLSDQISFETKLTDIVEFLSLNKNSEEWAKVAISLLNEKRYDHTIEISEKGYNIVEEAKKLEDYYKSLYESDE